MTDKKIFINDVSIGDEKTIDWIVSMTQGFAGESHIYANMGFNPEKFREYIIGCLHHNHKIYFAHDGKQGMGYTLFYLDDQYVDKINLEVVTLFVRPEARGTPAARKLAEAIALTMDEWDCAYGQVSICAAFTENEHLINTLTANVFKKYGFYDIGIILGRKGPSWDNEKKD